MSVLASDVAGSYGGASKDALELATLASIATRIEPQLLRALRIGAGTGLDVSAEADLWFSQLVRTRASTGILLADDALPRLRERLGSDPEKLERAWAVTQRVHERISPALRAEEELVYLTLKGLDDPATRKRAQALLRQLVATLTDESRRGAVAWADRALTRFPSELMNLDEARMLAVGTAFRSGRTEHANTVDLATEGGRYRWLQPRTEGRTIGVRWVEGGVELGPSSMAEAHAIDVPGVAAVLQLTWIEEDAERSETVRLTGNERHFVAVQADSVEVSVFGGARYAVSAATNSDLRAPRVQIEYDIEIDGAEAKVQLPFVIGVLADLCGDQPSRRPLEERRTIGVSEEGLDGLLTALGPTLSIRIDGGPIYDGDVTVGLGFRRLEDFEPEQILEQIMRSLPSLFHVTEARKRLQQLHEKADGYVGAEEILSRFEKTMQDPTDEANYVRDVVDMLLRPQAMADEAGPGGDLQPLLHGAIADLDRALSALVTNVLHHEDFMRLESAWRGLAFLHEPDSFSIRIDVLDINREELWTLSQRFRETGRQGDPLHRLFVEETFGVFEGWPYGCLVADFSFSNNDDDVELLTYLSDVAESAQAPVIAGGSPNAFGVDTFRELSFLQMLQPAADPATQSWRDLRSEQSSRYLQLCLPRMLGRARYDRDSAPIKEFVFDEVVEDPSTDALWINAAYAMAANIGRSFEHSGWFSNIRGAENGGAVEGLPVFALSAGADSTSEAEMVGPMDAMLTDRREAELAEAGYACLCQQSNTDRGVFYTTRSLHAPPRFESNDDYVSARLQGDMRAVLVVSRFAHYLRCILRDKVGSFRSIADTEQRLNSWLLQYVDGDPANSTLAIKSMKPLAAAVVESSYESRTQPPGLPYQTKLTLRPMYQFDEPWFDVSVSIPLPNVENDYQSMS